jgi:histidine ammonia-lyase
MKTKKSVFCYGKDKLTPLKATQIASGLRKGVLTPEIKKRVNACFQDVAAIAAEGKSVYGINTGFGPLCQTTISPKQVTQLQENILRSHCVGVGDFIEPHLAKLMFILKTQALCFGYSGVSTETIKRILWHIDHDILPYVPSQGSVGASGDLAPLAHLFLPLIGVGYVSYKGKRIAIKAVLKKYGLKSLKLGPKEGLALINGTQFIAAHAVDAVVRFHNCLEAADIIGALSLEAMLGSMQPFKAKLHRLRPYQGAGFVAHRLTQLLHKSKLLASHTDCNRVQDPYSLRCMPQVHGTSRDAWSYINQQVLIELNSVTDNPIIFSKKETISGGSFHGQPLALPMDYACLAASELGNISERRTYLLLEGKGGLPLLLMKDTGINSGFMIPQYTAAALVSENKTLCYPASADSIPTSVGQEDHVSMGSISARKARTVIDNLEKVLAVELLTAAQALDYRRPVKSTCVLEACHQLIRKHITHAEKDRVFGQDLNRARKVIARGELVAVANGAAKKHGINLNGKLGKNFAIE